MKKKKTYLKPDITQEDWVIGDVLCVSSGKIEGIEIENWTTSFNNL